MSRTVTKTDEQTQPETTTAIEKHEQPKPPMLTGQRGLELKTIDDMYRFANYIIAGGFAPKGMEKPETVLVALQMGLEIGLSPMASMQNIAVINGRPAVWGDAVPGLVRGSGLMEKYEEYEIGTYPNDDYGYRVTSKRKGDPKPIITDFTIADAKKAGLWGKTGPWTFYPKRMLKMRARAFNLRDNFPDVLKGLYTVEEMKDVAEAEYEVIDERTQTEKLADVITGKTVAPQEPELPTINIDTETGEIADTDDPFDGITDAEVQQASDDFKLQP